MQDTRNLQKNIESIRTSMTYCCHTCFVIVVENKIMEEINRE